MGWVTNNEFVPFSDIHPDYLLDYLQKTKDCLIELRDNDYGDHEYGICRNLYCIAESKEYTHSGFCDYINDIDEILMSIFSSFGLDLVFPIEKKFNGSSFEYHDQTDKFDIHTKYGVARRKLLEDMIKFCEENS